MVRPHERNIYMVLIYLLISIGASIVGAISGIGGGVIIKPTLDIFSSYNVSVISFLSGNTVLAMTISSLIRNKSSDIKLDKKIGSLLALGGVLGGLIGKYLFDILRISFSNDALIGSIQSISLAILTLSVLIFTICKHKIPSWNFRNFGISLFIGVLLGAIASFLGIGGGPINLAVLYLFFSMDSKKAALHSIYIIFFSQATNLIFTIASRNLPSFPSLVLVLMIIGGIGGGLVGAELRRNMNNKQVDVLFGVVMAIIIGISTYNFIAYRALL